MKKLVFILAIAIVTLHTGNRVQAKTESNGNSVPAESVSKSSAEEGSSSKLTKETFLKMIWDYENSPKEWKYKGDKPAMIDFYADWCGPCRKAAPIVEEIAKDYAGKINVYKIDTQKERELASVFGVSSIPAFLYIPMEGKPTFDKGIGRTNEETKKKFEEIINKVLLTSN